MVARFQKARHTAHRVQRHADRPPRRGDRPGHARRGAPGRHHVPCDRLPGGDRRRRHLPRQLLRRADRTRRAPPRPAGAAPAAGTPSAAGARAGRAPRPRPPPDCALASPAPCVCRARPKYASSAAASPAPVARASSCARLGPPRWRDALDGGVGCGMVLTGPDAGAVLSPAPAQVPPLAVGRVRPTNRPCAMALLFLFE